MTENKTEVLGISPEHFLQNPKVIEVITKRWPDCLPLLKAATTPQPSENPNDMELWENEERMRRIKKLSEGLQGDESQIIESIIMLLYEECFGVNTRPGEGFGWLKNDSSAPTPGGFISHRFQGDTMNGTNIEGCLDLPFTGSDLISAASSLPSREQRVALITQSVYTAYKDSLRSMDNSRMVDLLMSGKSLSPELEDEINLFGFRVIKFAKEQNLGELVSDVELQRALIPKSVRQFTRLYFWHAAWRYFSRAILNENSTFHRLSTENNKIIDNEQNKRLLDNLGLLLKLRLAPDYQGLFKHYSLYGYKD